MGAAIQAGSNRVHPCGQSVNGGRHLAELRVNLTALGFRQVTHAWPRSAEFAPMCSCHPVA